MPERTRTEETRAHAGRWIPEEAREHLKAAHAEMHRGLEALFPPEFIEHRRAARREMLLAARSWIDHALQRMEEKRAR